MIGGHNGGEVGTWPYDGRSEVRETGVVIIGGPVGTCPENLAAKLSTSNIRQAQRAHSQSLMGPNN